MAKRKLIYWETEILNYLKKYPDSWHSPAVIGDVVGHKPYNSSSAWASPKLRNLVKLGFAERNEKGRYRIKKEKNKEIKIRNIYLIPESIF